MPQKQKGKNFLIDTSVILDSPQHIISLYQNGENNIYISDVILMELNKKKDEGGTEIGFFAREFITALDEGTKVVSKNKSRRIEKKKKENHKQYQKTSITGDTVQEFECIMSGALDGITINVIHRDKYKQPNVINDMKILEIAKDYSLDVITNDIALKIIALSRSIHAESMKRGSVDAPENITFRVKKKYENGLLEQMLKHMNDPTHEDYVKTWTQIDLIETKEGSETGIRSYYVKLPSGISKVEEGEFKRFTVKPLNVEQKSYAKMLASNFQVMVATGSTGSGKTLLALQEGLRRVEDPNDPIDGIVYMRNTVTSNDSQAELGFRKGDQDQKLGYFAYPLYGAINFILEQKSKIEKKKGSRKDSQKDFEKDIPIVKESQKNTTVKEDHTESFMKQYNIEIMDIAHARGITINNKFVLFDETQNASNDTMKLIGTRMGKHSRMVLMGDFRQVDHPYLSKNRNALVSLLQVAKKDDMLAAIQLTETIRSEIANWFQEKI